jgi:hypothetical protein
MGQRGRDRRVDGVLATRARARGLRHRQRPLQRPPARADGAIVRQLPGAGQAVPIADSIAVLSAVLDGLWIEFYLSEERTPKDRCIALCEVTAKRLFCA